MSPAPDDPSTAALEEGVLLEEALQAWEGTRRGVIAEVDDLPADRFDFRIAEGTRSVAELAAHVLEVSEMMVGELCRETSDFRRAPFEALLEEHAGSLRRLREKEALLRALRETLDAGMARFRAVGETHLLGPVRGFDGKRVTRLAWLHHGVAQEMYHRGQLALYARALGRIPALTKRIRGED